MKVYQSQLVLLHLFQTHFLGVGYGSEVWVTFKVEWPKITTVGAKIQLSTNLFSVFPPTPIEHVQDGAVGAKKLKVFHVDPKAKCQFFELYLFLFFELILLGLA